LHSVLPKLGLPGLVEERKGPDMVYEQVAQYGQLRILWRHFSLVPPKWGTKAPKCSWRIQFHNLISDLLADKLAFEVYKQCEYSFARLTAKEGAYNVLAFPSIRRRDVVWTCTKYRHAGVSLSLAMKFPSSRIAAGAEIMFGVNKVHFTASKRSTQVAHKHEACGKSEEKTRES
jgi:hypothetical protein